MKNNASIIRGDGQAFTLRQMVELGRANAGQLLKSSRSALAAVTVVTLSLIALPALTSNASTNHSESNSGATSCGTTTTVAPTTTTTTTKHNWAVDSHWNNGTTT